MAATGDNSTFTIPNGWKPSECIVLEARVYVSSKNRYYNLTNSVWFDGDLAGGGRVSGNNSYQNMTCTIKFLKI